MAGERATETAAPARVEPASSSPPGSSPPGSSPPGSSPPERASSPPTPLAPPPPPPVPATPPLGGPPFLAIDVAGHEPAIVAVPIGSTAPQPIVLATHGNYDTPDWQCQIWRDIVGASGFVLCPRGIARPDSPSRDDVRFTYASNAHLEREIEAALAALRARFGSRVAEGPVTYTGFSLGAIMGVAIAARATHPGRYEAMVLVEGGHDRWTQATAKAFAMAGGKRVLFACGQASCFLDAKRASAHLERAKVATKIVGVKDAGHGYGGRVADQVKGAWVFVEPPEAPGRSRDQ